MKTSILLLTSLFILSINTSAIAGPHNTARLAADLSGGQEVRTVPMTDANGVSFDLPVGSVVTGAHGKVHFKLSHDKTMLKYHLQASGFSMDSVVSASHIHLGPAGENGPPIFFLFKAGPQPDDGADSPHGPSRR